MSLCILVSISEKKGKTEEMEDAVREPFPARFVIQRFSYGFQLTGKTLQASC
jgi:hypothetical protein